MPISFLINPVFLCLTLHGLLHLSIIYNHHPLFSLKSQVYFHFAAVTCELNFQLICKQRSASFQRSRSTAEQVPMRRRPQDASMEAVVRAKFNTESNRCFHFTVALFQFSSLVTLIAVMCSL